MGCCSPNKAPEYEVINNSSQFQKKSINGNHSTAFIYGDFIENKNQIDIENINLNEPNIEENSGF